MMGIAALNPSYEVDFVRSRLSPHPPGLLKRQKEPFGPFCALCGL